MSNTFKSRLCFLFAWSVWHLMVTTYYGWNMVPQSEGEILFDGIFIFMIWHTLTTRL